MVTPIKEFCGFCGAPMVEYRQGLNVGLRYGLRRLYLAGDGPRHISALGLDFSQRNNFQKLQYFGLIAKCYDADGEHRNGWWQITDLGLDFILGFEPVPQHVWTYRNEFVRAETDLVYIWQIEGGYQSREEWWAEARNRHDETGTD